MQSYNMCKIRATSWYNCSIVTWTRFHTYQSLRDKESDTRSLVRDMRTKEKRIDYLNEQVEELKAKLSGCVREKDDYKRYYDQQISDMESRIRKVASKGKEASQRAQQLEVMKLPHRPREWAILAFYTMPEFNRPTATEEAGGGETK